VFGANLIQMIFAVLQLNPVMNIMCLPFALVVSVVASTTVFRNVFTSYDAFSKDSSGPTSGSKVSEGIAGLSAGMSGRPRFNLSHNHSTAGPTSSNDIPLGEYKSQHETITVTKVVDIDVDHGGHPKYAVSTASLLRLGPSEKLNSLQRKQWDSDASSLEKERAL
jgi:hypothetical protein